MRSACLVAVAGLLAGCGPVLTAAPPVSAPASAPSVFAPAAFPPLVVAAPHTRILADGPHEVRLATPRAGLPLKVQAGRPDGLLAVAVGGGVELVGLVPLDALGVLVCEPGPVGERWYAGRGNLLLLRSTVTGGRLQVGGTVELRERPFEEGQPFERQFRRVEVAGELATRRLCTAVPPPGRPAGPPIARLVGEVYEDDFPDGTPRIDIPKGEELTLRARPDGEPVYTRPADRWGYSLVRLRRAGDWDLVAAGSGPYLLGWIRARPDGEPYGVGGLGLVGRTPPGPMSLHGAALKHLPLHQLAAGVEIRQFGRVQAHLTKPGWARASTLRDGWRFVVAAVDDDLVVEGWIEPQRLGPLVEAGAP